MQRETSDQNRPSAVPEVPGTLLTGRVALVTGGSRGIGAGCVAALVRAGAHVIAVSRQIAAHDAGVPTGPGTVEPWTADVTSDAFYQRIEALPRLDVLVNNAGANQPEPFLDVEPATLDRLVGLNVRAVFLTAQAAVQVMRRTGDGGSIIHISSQMGHVGAPMRTVYCMTKHAVEGLSKAMAVELAPLGIRVNTVAPTFVETPMTGPMFTDPAFRAAVLAQIPLARLASPADVAAAVVYLASGWSAMVTGHSLRVDGGWTAR